MTRTLRSALQASDSSPRSKSLSQQITHSSKVVQLFKYYRSRFLLHARPTYSRLIYIAILFDIRLPVRTPICTTFSIYFHSRETLFLRRDEAEGRCPCRNFFNLCDSTTPVASCDYCGTASPSVSQIAGLPTTWHGWSARKAAQR